MKKSIITKKFFTMVELLVVISLMAIIIGISLPGLGKMIAGGAVGMSSHNVTSMLKFGRNYAMSKRTYVALICPDEIALPTDNNAVYKGFRLALVSRPDAAGRPFIFYNWVEDTEWNFVQDSSLLKLESGFSEVNDVDLTALGGRKKASCYAFVFSPSGKISVNGKALDVSRKSGILIAEGYVEKGKIIIPENTKDNRVYIISEPITGSIVMRKDLSGDE